MQSVGDYPASFSILADLAVEQFNLIYGRYPNEDETGQMPDLGKCARECDFLSALQTWLTRSELYRDHTITPSHDVTMRQLCACEDELRRLRRS